MRWRASGLFRRFLIAFLGLTLLPAALITGAYLYESRRRADYSGEQFRTALIGETRRHLADVVESEANRMALLFGEIQHDLVSSAPAAAEVYARSPEHRPVDPGRAGTLRRGPRGGWYNAPTDPVCVFLPDPIRPAPEIEAEIRALTDLLPELQGHQTSHTSVVQAWFISDNGPSLIVPNRDMTETLLPDYDARTSAFFKPATPSENPAGAPVWTDLYNDPAGLGVMVSCIMPVKTADGRFRGVLGADVTLASFQQGVVRMGQGWEGVFVVDRRGRLLFASEETSRSFGLQRPFKFAEELKVGIGDLPAAIRPVALSMAAGGSGVLDVDLSGKRLVGFAPIGAMGWGVGVIASHDEILRPASALEAAQRSDARREGWTLAAFGVGFVLVASAFAWGAARALSRRLVLLAEAARAVSLGDLDARVPDLGRDEIGILAATLNRMLQDLRRTHRQMVQTEKLTALGTLVSGICHELNNLIGPILGFAEMLEDSGLQGRQLEQVQSIQKAAKSAKDVVDTLLGFGRGAGGEREPCDLNKTLKAACDLVAHRCRSYGIKLALEPDPALPETIADARAIQQAFLNILTNAVQEMERTGGALTVRSSYREGLLLISIEDTGPGIPPEHLPKIFDPFFTTKPAGQGTGLGLSLALGHIQAHGGDILAENVAPHGARFTIRLPRVRGTEVRRRFVTPALAPTPSGPRRRVLLVEDDLSMRGMLTQFLSPHYDLAVCSTGREALGVIDREPFDLIVSDIKMRDVTGRDLYLQTKQRRPDVAAKFLFITGDAFAEETRDFLERERVECLRKPFELRDLQTAVERRLAVGPEAPGISC